MWRILQTIPRVVRGPVSYPVRPTPQVTYVEDDSPGNAADRRPQELQWVRRVHNRRAGAPERDKHDGKRERDEHKADTEWQEWIRSFRGDQRFNHCLAEVVGWSTALLLGVQLSHYWSLSHDRRCRERHNLRSCRLYQLALSMPQTGTQRAILPQSRRTESSNYREHSQENYQIRAETSTTTAKESSVKAASSPSTCVDADLSWSEPLCHDLTDESDFDILTSSDLESCDEDLQESSREPSTDTSLPVFREAEQEWDKLERLHGGARSHLLALRHARAGRYELARALWENAGRQGYATAYYNLALCCEQGWGGSTGMGQVASHYSRAAEVGHPKALYNLALLYLRGSVDVAKDGDTALKLLERASETGLAKAQTELGVLYTEGEHRDLTKAASLFTKATEQKDSLAEYYLGICCEHGWGVDQDMQRAADHYANAAKSGHKEALHNLAVFTENGLGGLRRDKHRALDLYKEAAGKGDVSAQREAQRLEEQLQMEDSPSLRLGKIPRTLAGSVSSPSLFNYVQQHMVDFGTFTDIDLLSSSKIGNQPGHEKRPHSAANGVGFDVNLPEESSRTGSGDGSSGKTFRETSELLAGGMFANLDLGSHKCTNDSRGLHASPCASNRSFMAHDSTTTSRSRSRSRSVSFTIGNDEDEESECSCEPYGEFSPMVKDLSVWNAGRLLRAT